MIRNAIFLSLLCWSTQSIAKTIFWMPYKYLHQYSLFTFGTLAKEAGHTNLLTLLKAKTPKELAAKMKNSKVILVQAGYSASETVFNDVASKFKKQILDFVYDGGTLVEISYSQRTLTNKWGVMSVAGDYQGSNGTYTAYKITGDFTHPYLKGVKSTERAYGMYMSILGSDVKTVLSNDFGSYKVPMIVYKDYGKGRFIRLGFGFYYYDNVYQIVFGKVLHNIIKTHDK